MNVAVWASSSGYVDGHFVGTGECGGMSCNERLCGETFVGHW